MVSQYVIANWGGGIGVDPGSIQAYAGDRTVAADNYIAQLGQLSADLVPPLIIPEFPTVGNAPAISIPTPPVLEDIVWVSPGIPETFTEELNVDTLVPAAFTGVAPVLAFGSAPVAFSEIAPDAPGISLVFDDPTLTVTLPAPPDLLSLNVVPFDGLSLPTFSETSPVLTAVEPSLVNYVPGSQYTSSLLTTLQTTLNDRVTNGGTGLNAAAENAIFDRGREREARALGDAQDSLDQMESLGYSLPPGAYVDARLKLLTEMEANNTGISREILIAQAELEQKNVQHALTQATQLEGVLINYTNQTEQRLFESTKFANEVGIEIYNAKVRAFTSLVDAYKSTVQVYEAQVRAEVARVDAYRTQIQAEEAKAQINRVLVEQFKIQSDVALSNIEIYKAEIEGIRTKAEIERLKVNVFGEQVKAYTAKINAYTAGVEGYRATVSAEASKQDAFKSQVDAYKAEVDAATAQIEARIEEYKAKIDAKNSEWDGYRAIVQGETAHVQAIAAGNISLSDSYRAEVQGISAFNETLTKQYQVTLDQAQRVSEIGVSAAQANAQLYMTTRSLALDAAKVGAQVSAQLGAAALNALNWSSSISSSDSDSTSRSTSTSDNTNTNISI